MKKLGALALSSLILSSLILSASAAFVPNSTDVGSIKYTIPQGYAEHKLDGVISEGEYEEITRPEFRGKHSARRSSLKATSSCSPSSGLPVFPKQALLTCTSTSSSHTVSPVIPVRM